jgi:hypothetical protein
MRIGSALRFGDVDATTRALVPVGIVTLKALRPLFNKVRGELLAQGRFPVELADVIGDSDLWHDLGWGIASAGEIPVTLQLSALPNWPRSGEKGKTFQVRGEMTFVEPPPAKVVGRGTQ